VDAPVEIVPATAADMPTIEACIRRFKLDDEALAPAQFIVVRSRGRLVAFGRIKPYGRVAELGSVAVLEAARGCARGGGHGASKTIDLAP
jgi:N-acetylglutamate synthase-like GNAT family acetyltransferase